MRTDGELKAAKKINNMVGVSQETKRELGKAAEYAFRKKDSFWGLEYPDIACVFSLPKGFDPFTKIAIGLKKNDYSIALLDAETKEIEIKNKALFVNKVLCDMQHPSKLPCKCHVCSQYTLTYPQLCCGEHPRRDD